LLAGESKNSALRYGFARGSEERDSGERTLGVGLTSLRLGERLVRGEVEDMMVKVATEVRMKILAMPSRASPFLVGKPAAQCQNILLDHVSGAPWPCRR
jgi:hypothetical protein